MFPSTSTFRSGNRGAAWWYANEPGGRMLYATQWDALLRRYQAKARSLLRAVAGTYGWNRASGVCPSPRGFWDHQDVLRGDAPVDLLGVTGVWDERTIDSLGALMCNMGSSQDSQALFQALQQRQFTPTLLRWIIWITFYVTQVGSTDRPGWQAEGGVNGGILELPPGTILPDWGSRVVSSGPDQHFAIAWPADGPLPQELQGAAGGGGQQGGSLAPVTTQPPAPEDPGLTLRTALLVAGAAVGVTLLGAGLVVYARRDPKRGRLRRRSVPR